MIYSKYCNLCEHTFDVNCSMAAKDEPKPCSKCSSVDTVYRPSAPAVSMRGDRFTAVTARPSGFKEVISKIQERNPRTEICQR